MGGFAAHEEFVASVSRAKPLDIACTKLASPVSEALAGTECLNYLKERRVMRYSRL